MTSRQRQPLELGGEVVAGDRPRAARAADRAGAGPPLRRRPQPRPGDAQRDRRTLRRRAAARRRADADDDRRRRARPDAGDAVRLVDVAARPPRAERRTRPALRRARRVVHRRRRRRAHRRRQSHRGRRAARRAGRRRGAARSVRRVPVRQRAARRRRLRVDAAERPAGAARPRSPTPSGGRSRTNLPSASPSTSRPPGASSKRPSPGAGPAPWRSAATPTARVCTTPAGRSRSPMRCSRATTRAWARRRRGRCTCSPSGCRRPSHGSQELADVIAGARAGGGEPAVAQSLLLDLIEISNRQALGDFARRDRGRRGDRARTNEERRRDVERVRRASSSARRWCGGDCSTPVAPRSSRRRRTGTASAGPDPVARQAGRRLVVAARPRPRPAWQRRRGDPLLERGRPSIPDDDGYGTLPRRRDERGHRPARRSAGDCASAPRAGVAAGDGPRQRVLARLGAGAARLGDRRRRRSGAAWR